MRKMTLFLSILALAAFAALPGRAAEPRAMVDLVTHNQILIKASPAQIWPHIVEPNAWKKGARLMPAGGNPAGKGARFKAVAADKPESVLFHVENADVEPEKRRTIRLNTLDGTLIGFASWQLRPQKGATLVEYHVYCWAALPDLKPGASPAEVAAARKSYYDANYERFAAELSGLKKLIEESP